MDEAKTSSGYTVARARTRDEFEEIARIACTSRRSG
jgi:hypothetical protein